MDSRSIRITKEGIKTNNKDYYDNLLKLDTSKVVKFIKSLSGRYIPVFRLELDN